MSSRYEVFGVIIELCDLLSLICHWNVYVRSYCIIPIEFCDLFYGCCTICTIMFIVISFVTGKLGILSSLTHFLLHYDIAPGSMITVLKAVRFMRINRIWMHLLFRLKRRAWPPWLATHLGTGHRCIFHGSTHNCYQDIYGLFQNLGYDHIARSYGFGVFLSLIYGAHYICQGGISFATWSPMQQVCLGPVGGRQHHLGWKLSHIRWCHQHCIVNWQRK